MSDKYNRFFADCRNSDNDSYSSHSSTVTKVPSSGARGSHFFAGLRESSSHESDRYADGGSVKQQARKMAKMGRHGDTDLVHVNKQEERMLKAMGGRGSVNPRTGLREYAREVKNKPVSAPIKKTKQIRKDFAPNVFLKKNDIFDNENIFSRGLPSDDVYLLTQKNAAIPKKYPVTRLPRFMTKPKDEKKEQTNFMEEAFEPQKHPFSGARNTSVISVTGKATNNKGEAILEKNRFENLNNATKEKRLELTDNQRKLALSTNKYAFHPVNSKNQILGVHTGDRDYRYDKRYTTDKKKFKDNEHLGYAEILKKPKKMNLHNFQIHTNPQTQKQYRNEIQQNGCDFDQHYGLEATKDYPNILGEDVEALLKVKKVNEEYAKRKLHKVKSDRTIVGLTDSSGNPTYSKVQFSSKSPNLTQLRFNNAHSAYKDAKNNSSKEDDVSSISSIPSITGVAQSPYEDSPQTAAQKRVTQSLPKRNTGWQ